MKTYYLDSSVAVRFFFRDAGAFEFPDQGRLVSSALLRVECFRALDRIHRLRHKSPEQVMFARSSFYRLLETVDLIDLTKVSLERASQSFDAPIKTLDAIHLSTALLYREESKAPLVMLTHDLQLGRAARSQDLEVVGCDV